jgi:flagellar motor protein MotB
MGDARHGSALWMRHRLRSQRLGKPATTLLFDSGEATLKSGGVDVLKRIGGVLKQYPDRTIHIAGHTDNFPIRGALVRTFPTNMELSQARADSAQQALIEGGMTSDTETLAIGIAGPSPAIRPARAAR